MSMGLNLFSVFDPSSGFGLSMNWVSLVIAGFLFPCSKLLILSRGPMGFSKVFYSLYKEMGSLLVKGKLSAAFMFVSLFMFIFFMNCTGLLPQVFTPTSHLVVSLSLALPLWLSYFLFGWASNTKWMMGHLLPQGTPLVLMPFMVLVESVSSVIRPGTLSVRLAANMIAGHMLLGLMSSSFSVLNIGVAFSGSLLQILLVALEVAVAGIQAYVLVILSVLYASEV